jgi:DNA polymerase-3 subunit delta'
MNSPLTFHSFIGNRCVVEILRRAVDQGRLPHALIFAGPSGIGKRTLALLLAQHLNCLQPKNSEACNTCTSCRKIIGAMHPDVRVIERDGAYIKIDQLRDLINEIAYQPFEGRYRVAILDGAEQMRVEAANCLLKTLEEPASRSILILVTPKPYLLLRTIRSRARMLQFGLIEEADIEAYLTIREGRSPEDARLAAVLSNGSLGAALAFDAERNRDMRQQALRFVTLLLGNGRFTQASALAASVVREKELFQPWVEITATLLQDIYYAQVAPARMSQLDIAGELTSLAQSASHAAVVSAIEAVKNLKAALQQNVNRQLALETLFLAESAAVRRS